MSKYVNVLTNVINTNADGEDLGAGDSIYVDFGVKLEALTSGTIPGNTYDGIDADQARGAGITATIEGMVVGSDSGISVDSVGDSTIVIGSAGSVVSTSSIAYAIFLGGGGNSLENAGQITGSGGGVEIRGVGQNTVNNGGDVTTGGVALYVNGDSNNVENSGALTCGFGIDIQAETSGGNVVTNSGLISAAAGIVLAGATGFADTVNNSGTIQSITAGIEELGTGTLVVTNSGNVSGSDGVDFRSATGTDQLDNTGTISAQGTRAAVYQLDNGAFVVNNSGSITGVTDAIENESASGNVLHNSAGGIISAGQIGVFFRFGENSVVNRGDISGDTDGMILAGGVAPEGSNTMNNSGTISSAAGTGLIVVGGSNTVTNAGNITGLTEGLSVFATTDSHNGNSVVNSGTITGQAGLGVDGISGDIDAVHNSGTIQGGESEGFGIQAADVGQLTVINTGTISGDDAVFFSSSTSDVLHNSGTIAGAASAVTESGTGALTVVNSGHILGDVDFGSGAGTYSGVLGTLDGTVNGGGGNDTIKGGADGETLNGGAGNDTVKGGIGGDTITGGAGADKLVGGGGNDTFVYTGFADSHGPSSHDTIVGFDAVSDTFDFEVAVTGVDKAIATGTLDKASFNTDLQAILTSTALHAHHAVLVTPTAGDLAGHTYLIVDDNGVAGFQSTTDYVIELSQGVHLANLSTTNFI